MLQRTTIVLPPRLKSLVEARARSQGISFAEYVRRTLDRSLAENAGSRRPKEDPFLGDSAVYAGPVPADLSLRHDAYLYGDG